MLDFRTTDRPELEARMAGRAADYARQLLATDAEALECDALATRLLDLAMGRTELRAATDPARQELLIGYLLSTHDLYRLAVPVLSSVPYTLLIPGGGSGGAVYWANILNKPALVTPAQLETALANVATTRPITVSLAGNKTAGTLKTGDFIAKGTKYQDLWERVLVEAILPAYTPAALSLTQSAPAIGEVGESVTNTLTATFARGDAGALAALRVKASGAVLAPGNGTASPLTREHTVVRALEPVTYQATADYAAGAPKAVAPAGTPDVRPAQVRHTDAPQAAETEMPSNELTFGGAYRLFFGPAAAAPTNSTQVRALPDSQLTTAGNQFVLETGTAERYFPVVLAPGQKIQNVTDLDNQQANVTAAYQRQPDLQVADAGGALTARPFYLFTANAPYLSSARHRITTNG